MLSKARELNPVIELPDAEIEAVKMILSGEEAAIGQGYRTKPLFTVFPRLEC